jgi:ubiquinone biosynthesis protein
LEEGGSAIGRRITMVCSELGPTFVKLGQMLSTRPDILPAELIRELEALQDEVPPFDTPTAMRIIEEELARPVGQCFERIDERPFASGSIGQVYRARLSDGTEVIVKVRRPGIEDVLRLDIALLKWLAQTLEGVMPEVRIYRPRMLVGELEEMLNRELDYVNEASITARFAAAFEGDAAVRIPRVYWELSGPRVLTLQALQGINVSRVTSAGGAEAARIDRKLAARRLADAYLKQIFEIGLFHADPHPGNVLIDPPARIGLIDFGQVGAVTDEMLNQLLSAVYACVNREVDLVVDVLADLGAIGSETRRGDLRRSLQNLLDKYYGLPLKRLDLSRILAEFSDVIRRHDVVIPQEAVLLMKALGMVVSLTKSLDPDLVVLDLMRPRLEKAIKDQFSPARLSRGLTISGWHLWNVLRRAPSQLREAARRAATGGWRLQVRHENIERLISELDRSSNRLAFSIVIAAIIIGSSFVVGAGTDITIFEIRLQYFGIVGYLIAGVLGLGLAWAIYRSGRLH